MTSLATFSANVPVIFVTFRSPRFDNDHVAKIVASLAVSDIVNGIIAACCAGVAWSFQPGEQVPIWLLRVINSGMYTFGLCSLWHLAAVSVVKCSVIIRPLTHFTIFTDRVLRAIISAIWILSLVVGGCASNAFVTGTNFHWISMIAHVERQNSVLAYGFGSLNFIGSTLIITIAYTKVFLAVRRQVRSMPTDVLGSYGSSTIFGSSVRSAKNLFVICAAYYVTYLPVLLRLALRARGVSIPGTVEFAISWIYRSSAGLDGFLYIALHSSVRGELRRYLPRCLRPRPTNSVCPLTRAVGDRGGQRYVGSVDTGVRAPGTHKAHGTPKTPGASGTSGSPRTTGAPGIPGATGTPVVPGTPETHGAPGTPGAPGIPGSPRTLGAHGTPGVPGTPETHETPGTPGSPGSPETSGTPETPGAPVATVTSCRQHSTQPLPTAVL